MADPAPIVWTNNPSILPYVLTTHFADRLLYRAPWFLDRRRKKHGGGFEVCAVKLGRYVAGCIEIKRPRNIGRLLSPCYNQKDRYLFNPHAAVDRRVVLVVRDEALITILDNTRRPWLERAIHEATGGRVCR